MTARDPILIPADAAPDLALALADHAVAALIDEAMLTPKPGLVDLRGAGAHRDLSWPLMCASACALAWLGGIPRLMGANTHIGFHAAYNPRSGQEAGVANALVGAYLSQLGLPDKAVIYATQAPPNSMTWLTLPEARQVGIDVALSTVKISNESPAVSSNG